MDRKDIGIIIQARMGSQRLPGKMMLPILEEPVLGRLIERMKQVEGVKLMIATSRLQTDDVIADLCQKTEIICVREDEQDVIGRFIKGVREHGLQGVVRLTGDCPLMDPQMVSAMIDEFRKGHCDYYSNLRPRSFPRGLDCEIFTSELLLRAYMEKIPDDIPEYIVIPYVNRIEKNLKIGNYQNDEDYSTLRWTLDQQEDYDLITKIYTELYPRNPQFGLKDILKLYEKQPELRDINANVKQKSI